MQKGGPLQTHINECRLHAWQNTGDFAQVNIADQAALKCAFDMQLLQYAVFHNGNPRLLRRPIDQYVFLHGA